MNEPQQPDILAQLNEFSQRIGKNTWDPGKIDDEGQAPPPFVERPPVDLSQVPEPAEYFDEDEEPGFSPLIPQPTAPAPPPDFPRPDLAVAGNDAGTTIASYLGREVTLLEIEAVAVRRVVLRALQRQVRAQLAEVEALMPKRRRRKRGAGVAATVSAGSGAAPDQQPAPKKRGRPRKVKPA